MIVLAELSAAAAARVQRHTAQRLRILHRPTFDPPREEERDDAESPAA